MKNSAIDRTSEIFSADQVSMCRSWRRARRGPRLLAEPRPRPLAVTVVSPVAGRSGTTGGTGGAPGGPPVGGTVIADAGVAPPSAAWARCEPVVGIDCVAEAGADSPGAAVSVGAAEFPALSPVRNPVRTELGVRSLMPVSRSPAARAASSLAVTLGVGLVIVRRTGDRHDRDVLRQVHELDTHGRAVLVVAHAVDRRADHAAAGGDGVELVAERHGERPDQCALARLRVGGEYALAAAALGRVVLDAGPLGETALGGDEDVDTLLDDHHREQPVVVRQRDAAHPLR